MAASRTPKYLAKILATLLARPPEELALVPDAEGFVKIKELLKALHEEEGFGYVNRSHLNEIVLSVPDAPIEIRENRIRAQWDQLFHGIVAIILTKITFNNQRRVHRDAPDAQRFQVTVPPVQTGDCIERSGDGGDAAAFQADQVHNGFQRATPVFHIDIADTRIVRRASHKHKR